MSRQVNLNLCYASIVFKNVAYVVRKCKNYKYFLSQYMYEIIDDLSQSKGTINKVGLACLVYVRIYMIKAETTMRQAPRFSLALNFCLKLRLWVGYSTIFSWVFFSGLYRKERKQLENESRKVSASQKLLRRLHSSSSRKQRVKKIDAFKTFFLRLPPPSILTLFHFGKAESCIILWTW